MNELSEFIIAHTAQINNNDFTEVYRDANNQLKDSSSVGKLTELFLDAGIDPLKYMQAIPTHYIHYTSKVTSIVIPDSIITIDSGAFFGCKQLKSVTIADSVTSIDQSAFQECRGLKSVIIGNSVKNIGWSAFQSCIGLTSVTMGNGVKLIDGYAFHNCLDLTTINFNGTIAQWNSIGKGIRWDYNTGNYTIHCIDGDLEE